MKYKLIKIGDVFRYEGHKETVISKSDEYKIITTIDYNMIPTTWKESKLHLLKPIKEELPKEGVLVSKNDSLVYKLPDGSGYGFTFGRQSNYNFNNNWAFNIVGYWKPATEEQETKFIEMLWDEWVKMGNDEDTKIEDHAKDFPSKGLLNQGDYEWEPTCQTLWNKNGVIFHRGNFATPRKETTTTPQVGKQYTHKKGNTYTVIGFTNNLGDKEDKDFPVTVIYVDQEGRHWSRPLSRWHGSFELKK